MGDDKIFEFTFKNNEFLVSINEDETDKLIIELTDKLNGDKWKGIYESSCNYPFSFQYSLNLKKTLF